ncbi:MAG TPA: alpha/beta fold hydrolase [Allosphingosinicella sp.]|jgi:pimeloyl-ACP methyl ester carboxylesterase
MRIGKRASLSLFVSALLLFGCASGEADPPGASRLASPAQRLALATCRVPVLAPDFQSVLPGDGEAARCGTFSVPENRGRPGRMLPLKVIVIPSRSAAPAEPIFFLAGGPGQAATELAPGFAASPHRAERDIVLMDVRGTGEGTRLDCAEGGSDADIQSWLEPLFHAGTAYAACRDALAARADLTQYTTPKAMEDLDELRQALGYERIVIEGGSYGTRAAMTYIRMFGDRVRAATLLSLVPIENRAPLFHAAAAQRAFERVADQCAADAACRSAFPDVRGDLAAILARLRAAPARVTLPHPVTDAPTEVSITASAFGDALRVFLYSGEASREVPLLLSQARAGDFAPFARAALQSSRGLATAVRMGLLLSFTCSEDVHRIRGDEIARATAGSFIGDGRVRGQIAACSVWPRGEVPADYYRPFRSNVPVLLVSGDLDPVTPPSWGEVARRTFPSSVHLVMPGGHTPGSPCIDRIARQLYRTGTVRGLDTSCAAAERLPPFALPRR